MSFRGLARTPRRIARQLSEAARLCVLAATELEASARTGSDPGGTMETAARAKRESHRAALSSAHMFGGGLDRSDVVDIARALQTLADGLEGAAAAVGLARRVPLLWEALTGVIRDATRELAAAIERLDGPALERDLRLDRADELYDEWRGLVRTARAQALTARADPISAVAADMALRRLEHVSVACRRAIRTVRTVAIKHA